MDLFKTYETERLILKPVLEADASFIRELLNTPKWYQFIGDRNVKTDEDAANYIRQKMLPQFHKVGYGNFAVINREGNIPMGTVGLYHREAYEGVDIGFAFLPEYEGKGYGFEASRKMMELAFQEFGIEKINAYTNQDNVASQQLLGKLGFKKTGTTTFPGEEIALLVFEIERS